MYSLLSISFSFLALFHSGSALPAASLVARQNAAPVLPDNFPDPSFIEDSGAYYAFGTAGNGHFIQIARSPSFENPSWQLLNQDALSSPGSWTDGSMNTWAPFVLKAGNGQYVMYYAAPSSSSPAHHCIGTATSNSVTGPYNPSSQPWTCPLSVGGAIDAAAFKDPTNGNLYVVYKIDGNSVANGNPTPIQVFQVDPNDGVTIINPGNNPTLIDQDASDGVLVEAPGMFYQNGQYYLIYSSHYYNSNDYDIRWATCTSPLGPCTQPDRQILKTGDYGLTSPGSAAVDPAGGNFMFHATVSYDSSGNPTRYLYAGSVTGSNGAVTFNNFAN